MSREIPVTVARLDPESAGWLRALADTGSQRDTALARLRELVVRVARGEVARRGPRLQITTTPMGQPHRRQQRNINDHLHRRSAEELLSSQDGRTLSLVMT